MRFPAVKKMNSLPTFPCSQQQQLITTNVYRTRRLAYVCITSCGKLVMWAGMLRPVRKLATSLLNVLQLWLNRWYLSPLCTTYNMKLANITYIDDIRCLIAKNSKKDIINTLFKKRLNQDGSLTLPCWFTRDDIVDLFSRVCVWSHSGCMCCFLFFHFFIFVFLSIFLYILYFVYNLKV